MYHLTKCCRYRLVCGSYICPLLSNDTATFNVEDFKALGIKDYILDKSKTKKMDDDYNDYSQYDFNSGLQSRNRNGGQNNHMTLYDPIWLKKYMSLTVSLSLILKDNKPVHLGSLGTHFLEHFFGMIRRF